MNHGLYVDSVLERGEDICTRDQAYAQMVTLTRGHVSHVTNISPSKKKKIFLHSQTAESVAYVFVIF